MRTPNEETYLRMLAQLSMLELKEFRKLIDITISDKSVEATTKPGTVRFNPYDHFGRSGGGWTKLIRGIDRDLTEWSAIEGTYMQGGREHYRIGPLYLDFSIGKASVEYTIFQVNELGKPVIIRSFNADEWFPEVLDEIEMYL